MASTLLNFVLRPGDEENIFHPERVPHDRHHVEDNEKLEREQWKRKTKKGTNGLTTKFLILRLSSYEENYCRSAACEIRLGKLE
jgi:hypothetical protein